MKRFLDFLLNLITMKKPMKNTNKISPPPAPTNAVATAVGLGLVNFSWNDNSGNEQGFKIERCQGDTCTNFVQVGQVVANLRNFNDSNVLPGVVYRYRVRAFNTAGHSAYSNVASMRTIQEPTPPPPPDPDPVPPPPTGGVNFITHLQQIPVPNPPKTLPGAGGRFFDPMTGLEINVISDVADEASTSYSYWCPFNADNTLILSAEGILFGFDPVNRVRTPFKKDLNLLHATMGNAFEDAEWHSTDPHILFVRGGNKVYKLDVMTGAKSVYADYSARWANHYFFQMHKSADDQTFSFEIRNNADYSKYGYGAANASGMILLDMPLSHPSVSDLVDFDECQIDKSGRYLIAKFGDPSTRGAGQIEDIVYDFQTGEVKRLTAGAPHHSPDHGDNGTGIVVGTENWGSNSGSPGITARTFADPFTHWNAIAHANWDVSTDGHISLCAANESYALFCTYTENPKAIFRREILLVKIAPGVTNVVRRLGHHNSYIPDPGAYYSETPKGSFSRDGKFAALTTNWGVLNETRIIVVTIPDNARA